MKLIALAVLVAASTAWSQGIIIGAGGVLNIGSGGSGTFVALSGDATSTATGGATTVKGLEGVPFCNGYTPTNGQSVTLTTASSPNPCYTATTGSGGGLPLTGGTLTGPLVGTSASFASVGGIVYANPATSGTTTAGINEALASFGASPVCGIVQLPKGSFSITSTIGGTTINGRNGCILRGHGSSYESSSAETYLTWAGASGGTMIDLPYCSDCQVSDMTLDGGALAAKGVWVDNGSSLASIHNMTVQNMPSGSIAFESGAASGTVPGETHIYETNASNVGTCFYFLGANDNRVDGSNTCTPTQYGVHMAGSDADAKIADTTFASYGGVPITLFQVDTGNCGLVVNHVYGEEFSNIITAVGASNVNECGNITIENSGFNSAATAGSIGTVTQNMTFTLNNVQVTTPSSGPTFTFNPIGNAGSGAIGTMLINGGKWVNAQLINSAATSDNGYVEYSQGSLTNYSRSPFSGYLHLFDNRNIGLINSTVYETDNNLTNIYSHYPSTAGGSEQYGWYFNGGYLGGWNSYGSAPSTGNFDAYQFMASGTGGYKSFNGNMLVPGSAAAYHGSATGGVQMSDGTGTSGHLAAFNAAGSLTDGGMGSSYITSLTTTGTSGAATVTSGVLNIPQYAGGGSMTWPAAAGIAVYGGSSTWGTSLTAPASALVGISDTQTLTNKSIAGSEINSGTVGATYLPAALSSSASVNGTTIPASATLLTTGSTYAGTLTSSQVTTALTYTPVAPGANSSITSLTGLTTPLSVAQGGNGTATSAAYTVFGNFTSGTAAPSFTAAPTFSAANLTSFPTFNQSTTGNAATATSATTAANLSGTPALPNGTAATTQTAGDATTKLATDAFATAAAYPVANTTITVTTTSVPANSCLPSNTTFNTATLTGLTTSMTITGPTPAASVASVTGFTPASTGQLYFVVVPTAGTLDWQICNGTGTAIVPSASTAWNVGAR